MRREGGGRCALAGARVTRAGARRPSARTHACTEMLVACALAAVLSQDIPLNGVAVVAGDRLAGDSTQLFCLWPGDEGVFQANPPVSMPFQRIAAQCCAAGSDADQGNCRRKPVSPNPNPPGPSPDGQGNSFCVADASDAVGGNIKPFTYAEVVSYCGDLGLQLCGQSCRGRGCQYDKHPVYTNIACSQPRPTQPNPPSPPSPPPPSPPRAPVQIPANGVAILDSLAPPSAATLFCLFPGDEAVTSAPFPTNMPFQTIAAQCCTSGAGTPQEVCRRKPTWSGGISPSNEDCVAGKSGTGDIAPFTYSDVKYFCDSLGLELCQQACTGQGCAYDDYPVWTGLACPYGRPPPISPPRALPYPPPGPLRVSMTCACPCPSRPTPATVRAQSSYPLPPHRSIGTPLAAVAKPTEPAASTRAHPYPGSGRCHPERRVRRRRHCRTAARVPLAG